MMYPEDPARGCLAVSERAFTTDPMLDPGFSMGTLSLVPKGGIMKPTILIAERDEILRRNVKSGLIARGYEVVEAWDRTGALRSFLHSSPDLVLIGTSQGTGWDGLGVAVDIRKQDRIVPVILIAEHSSEAQAIAALRAGVSDYLKRPLPFAELLASVERNLHSAAGRLFSPPQAGTPGSFDLEPMIGESRAMQEIKAYLLKVAATDSTVL
ncbi:MAG: response regulator, partial [Deltaproteobacteria bacterium]|nr:response regulator [Deltaproteobacteria bacterium]